MRIVLGGDKANIYSLCKVTRYNNFVFQRMTTPTIDQQFMNRKVSVQSRVGKNKGKKMSSINKTRLNAIPIMDKH